MTDSVHYMIHEEIRPHDGCWAGEHWVFSLRTPVARKAHECCVCDETIEKGTKYVVYVTTNQEAPGYERWKLHGECYLESGLSRLNNERRPAWRWEG